MRQWRGLLSDIAVVSEAPAASNIGRDARGDNEAGFRTASWETPKAEFDISFRGLWRDLWSNRQSSYSGTCGGLLNDRQALRPPLCKPAMLRRLYDWCVDSAGKPHAAWVLGAVSFAESSFFPVPPDIMLIPMSLARPERAWFFATICTLASVASGLLGYFIGAVLLRHGRRMAHSSLRLWR